MRTKETFRKTVGVETATRDLILSDNLGTSNAFNKPIREALGFREIGIGTHPKFVSSHISHLYKELDNLAKERLPLDDLDGILRAWRERALESLIVNLLEKYGSKIWGDAMDKRCPLSNPRSQLLIEGDSEFYTTDLFYECSNHRAL